MLDASLRRRIEADLGLPTGAWRPVGGGCIGNGGRLELGGRGVFLKWGPAEVARTFPAEAAGLRVLGGAGVDALLIPAVLAAALASDEAPGYLLLDWIETGAPGRGYWERFGEALARLHATTGPGYGFDGDNFIGRLPQENAWADSWPVFFRERRLEPQIRRARSLGRWREAWTRSASRLLDRLDAWLPERPEASLLHGDLWSGNALAAADGRAALIDPAVYYGHAETDLAMSELFGGFPQAFYDGYAAVRPLDAGYDDRRAIYNLYHLLNHLNHFGGSYAGGVADVFRRFG